MSRLYLHQDAAVKFILDRKGTGAIYLEMGLGKTLCGIEIFKELREDYPALKMLVLCPLSLIEAAWHEDIQKFAPELVFRNLRKKAVFDADVYCANYEMLLGRHFKRFLGEILNGGPVMLFADESSRFRNFRAQTTAKILSMTHLFPFRIIASGTPAPNSGLEYFPQLKLIGAKGLPENFYIFRAKYFWLARGRQIADGVNGRAVIDYLKKGFKYQFRPGMDANFQEILKECAFHAKLDDCLDLPKTIDKQYLLEMHPSQRKTYLEMERHMIAEIRGKAVPAPLALTKLMKLRQIASGFLYGEGTEVFEFPNPKLKELLSILEDIGKNQVIIWCHFKREKTHILDALKENHPCSVLDGETKDRDSEISQFKAGETDYLIANPASAGHGLTLTNCHHQIYYSLSYSYETYAQARARTHRATQEHPTVYHHMLMESTIEPVILEVLKRKGSSQDILKAWLK